MAGSWTESALLKTALRREDAWLGLLRDLVSTSDRVPGIENFEVCSTDGRDLLTRLDVKVLIETLLPLRLATSLLKASELAVANSKALSGVLRWSIVGSKATSLGSSLALSGLVESVLDLVSS